MLPSMRMKDVENLIIENWKLRLYKVDKNQKDLAKTLNLNESVLSGIFTQKHQTRVATLDKIEQVILDWEAKQKE